MFQEFSIGAPPRTSIRRWGESRCPIPDSGGFAGWARYRALTQPGLQRIAGSPAEWQEAWTVNLESTGQVF
jgi:hypothetical protein